MRNFVNSCLRLSSAKRSPARELFMHKYFSPDEGFLSDIDDIWVKKGNYFLTFLFYEVRLYLISHPNYTVFKYH